MSSEEIFNNLKNWSRDYSYAVTTGNIIKDNDGKFILSQEIYDNIIQIMGYLDDEKVKEAFKELDINDDVTQDGYYDIEVLLEYNKGQYGEFGLLENSPYVYIEHLIINRNSNIINNDNLTFDEDDLPF